MFESEQQLMELSNESAQRNSDVDTIHIGLGVIFVALGVVLFRKLSVITPAFLLGGVLLILLGAPSGGRGNQSAERLDRIIQGRRAGNIGRCWERARHRSFRGVVGRRRVTGGADYISAGNASLLVMLRKRPIPRYQQSAGTS